MQAFKPAYIVSGNHLQICKDSELLTQLVKTAETGLQAQELNPAHQLGEQGCALSTRPRCISGPTNGNSRSSNLLSSGVGLSFFMLLRLEIAERLCAIGTEAKDVNPPFASKILLFARACLHTSIYAYMYGTSFLAPRTQQLGYMCLCMGKRSSAGLLASHVTHCHDRLFMSYRNYGS